MWCLLSLSILFLASANQELLNVGYIKRLTKLAVTEYTLRASKHYEHSVVYFPEIHEVSAHFTKKMAEKLKNGQKVFNFDASTITCAWGEGPDY